MINFLKRNKVGVISGVLSIMTFHFLQYSLSYMNFDQSILNFIVSFTVSCLIAIFFNTFLMRS